MKTDISPERNPDLTEAEVTLVNLFRLVPEKIRKAILELLFNIALNHQGGSRGEED
jgi:hypothetical protein